MFRFIEKMFIELLSACAIDGSGKSLVSSFERPVKYVSLNNQPCKSRQLIVNINSDKTVFYLFIASVVEAVTLLMLHMLEFAFQIK